MIRRIELLAFVLLLCSIASASAQVDGEALSNFEAATLVIGQKNFTSASCTIPNAKTMCDPYGEVVANKKLYIVDADYSRILGCLNAPLKNGAPANFVLGQKKFTTTGRQPGTIGANSL
jgi:hypothetical protein